MTESALCVVCCVCTLATAAEQERRTCDDCARKTGAIALPPPRRRATPCAKCNHTKLVRAIPRELTVLPDRIETVAAHGPMFAAYKLQTTYNETLATEVLPAHPRSGYGVLEMYICRKCGFTEWYCQMPEEIPIGPAHMTEEIDCDGSLPYR